jgi:hypothetical protein
MQPDLAVHMTNFVDRGMPTGVVYVLLSTLVSPNRRVKMSSNSKPVQISKAIFNALPAKEKRIQKGKRKFVLMKWATSPVTSEWVEVTWKN